MQQVPRDAKALPKLTNILQNQGISTTSKVSVRPYMGFAIRSRASRRPYSEGLNGVYR